MSQIIFTKQMRKMLEDLTEQLELDNGELLQQDYITVVKVQEFPGSRMARFSISTRSENDFQNHKNLGKYHALVNMYVNKKFVKLPAYLEPRDFVAMVDLKF